MFTYQYCIIIATNLHHRYVAIIASILIEKIHEKSDVYVAYIVCIICNAQPIILVLSRNATFI